MVIGYSTKGFKSIYDLRFTIDWAGGPEDLALRGG
jgi:hypothetical protein